MNFVILPSSHVLKEKAEELNIKEGSIRNKSIISLGKLMTNLGKKKIRGYYNASTVTKLMKDMLAGNSFTTGLFCVKQGHFLQSATTLKYFNICKGIRNFPIQNDGKVIGLLSKYRYEIMQLT